MKRKAKRIGKNKVVKDTNPYRHIVTSPYDNIILSSYNLQSVVVNSCGWMKEKKTKCNSNMTY